MRTDDPWRDVLASGRDDFASTAAPEPVPVRQQELPQRRAPHRKNDHSGLPQQPPSFDAHAAVYLAVQRSAAFQQVRRRYRRFVLPASVAFLTWYLAYVITATAAPELMARPVAGVVNVAMAAGLAQFATTFVLTWAYACHARLRRDRLALELRWETQDMARGTREGAR